MTGLGGKVRTRCAMVGNRFGKMKTLLALVLLVVAVSAVVVYGAADIVEATSAVSSVRPTEPARLLVCGAVLIALSAAVRRATFVLPKR